MEEKTVVVSSESLGLLYTYCLDEVKRHCGEGWNVVSVSGVVFNSSDAMIGCVPKYSQEIHFIRESG